MKECDGYASRCPKSAEPRAVIRAPKIWPEEADGTGSRSGHTLVGVIRAMFAYFMVIVYHNSNPGLTSHHDLE